LNADRVLFVWQPTDKLETVIDGNTVLVGAIIIFPRTVLVLIATFVAQLVTSHALFEEVTLEFVQGDVIRVLYLYQTGAQDGSALKLYPANNGLDFIIIIFLLLFL
jgi:hypothetical protein